MKKKNIALCLSGGGFRATLFHLGVLKRLHELDLLKHVKLLSAVSGGAVTAALFHKYVDRTPKFFDGTSQGNRDQAITQYIMKGSPISYDWKSFENQLLGATNKGILGSYKTSIGIWILLAITIIAVTINASQIAWAVDWYFPEISIMAFLLAMVLYLLLVSQVWRCECASSSNDKLFKEKDINIFYPALSPLVRTFLLPLMPSLMRLIALDILLGHKTCGQLYPNLKLYICAIELKRGREMVFSNKVLSQLGSEGSTNLWEQRYYRDDEFSSHTFDITRLPVSVAVAASSAFPPIFQPVVIRRKIFPTPHVGIFSDGGAVDNAALNVPIEMMIHCSRNRGRYGKYKDDRTGKEYGIPSFEESISDVFVINAGASISRDWERGSLLFPKVRLLHRIFNIIQGNQDENVIQKLSLTNHHNSPKYTGITINNSGFLLKDESRDSNIPATVQIRTHFDTFDPVEAAALVYSGYCQVDIMLSNKPDIDTRSDLKSFDVIAQEITGADKVGNMSEVEIILHSKYSHLKLNFIRKMCRASDWLLNCLCQICTKLHYK